MGRGCCGPLSPLRVRAGVAVRPGVVSIPSPFPHSPLRAGEARGGAARRGAVWATGTAAVASFPPLPEQSLPAPLPPHTHPLLPPAPHPPDPHIPVPSILLPAPSRRCGPSGAPCPHPCAHHAGSPPSGAVGPGAHRRTFLPSLPQCVFDDLSGSVSLSWVGDSTGVRWAEGGGAAAPLRGCGRGGPPAPSRARCAPAGHPRADHVPGALGHCDLRAVQALPQVLTSP